MLKAIDGRLGLGMKGLGLGINGLGLISDGLTNASAPESKVSVLVSVSDSYVLCTSLTLSDLKGKTLEAELFRYIYVRTLVYHLTSKFETLAHLREGRFRVHTHPYPKDPRPQLSSFWDPSLT